MTGLIPPFFFFTRKMVLMKLGGRGTKGTSSMAPFVSIEMVVYTLRRSGETYSGAGERGRRCEGGTIAFHGLEQMREGL
jgi:hypothetical protein